MTTKVWHDNRAKLARVHYGAAFLSFFLPLASTFFVLALSVPNYRIQGVIWSECVDRWPPVGFIPCFFYLGPVMLFLAGALMHTDRGVWKSLSITYVVVSLVLNVALAVALIDLYWSGEGHTAAMRSVQQTPDWIPLAPMSVSQVFLLYAVQAVIGIVVLLIVVFFLVRVGRVPS